MWEKQDKRNFCAQIAEKGGFTFLIELFIALNKDNLELQVLKCCALQSLQKLIAYFLNNGYDKRLAQTKLKTLLEQNLLVI